MIGTGHDHALRIAELLHEFLQFPDLAVLVLSSVQKEHRLLTGAQITEVVLVDRRADEEERVDVGQFAAGAGGNPCSKGEASDNQFLAGMFLHSPVDRGKDIFDLSLPFLVFPTAAADATKVESESSHIRVFQSARGTKDDLVVQSAAAERMGMTDDGDPGGILKIAVQRFEP